MWPPGRASTRTASAARDVAPYGASDPATTPRDPQVIVEELRALLATEGRPPPYVLVGHSIGGGYMELFAKAHRDEVAAVVLVDPRHRDFLATCEAAQLDSCGITEAELQTQPRSAIAEYRAFPLAAEEIRDGEQIIVPGAGHVIQLDRPDVVIHTILDLLP